MGTAFGYSPLGCTSPCTRVMRVHPQPTRSPELQVLQVLNVQLSSCRMCLASKCLRMTFAIRCHDLKNFGSPEGTRNGSLNGSCINFGVLIIHLQAQQHLKPCCSKLCSNGSLPSSTYSFLSKLTGHLPVGATPSTCVCNSLKVCRYSWCHLHFACTAEDRVDESI